MLLTGVCILFLANVTGAHFQLDRNFHMSHVFTACMVGQEEYYSFDSFANTYLIHTYAAGMSLKYMSQAFSLKSGKMFMDSGPALLLIQFIKSRLKLQHFPYEIPMSRAWKMTRAGTGSFMSDPLNFFRVSLFRFSKQFL